MLRADPQQRTLFVSHSDIRGFMPAMAMPFRVRDEREMAGLAPGARVGFELVVKRRESFARKVQVRAAGAEGLDKNAVRVSDPIEKIAVGEPMPDFDLIDQSGQPVHLSDFRGKVVAVNFIYTRCPLPEVCPRLSANFARIQKRFTGSMGSQLMLVSITLDPQYDTPEVLSKYAKIWGAGSRGWRFLTGELREIQAVAARFGMVWWPEEGLITHTSRTAIVNREGKVAAVVEGVGYQAGQLADLIALELEGTDESRTSGVARAEQLLRPSSRKR